MNFYLYKSVFWN